MKKFKKNFKFVKINQENLLNSVFVERHKVDFYKLWDTKNIQCFMLFQLIKRKQKSDQTKSYVFVLKQKSKSKYGVIQYNIGILPQILKTGCYNTTNLYNNYSTKSNKLQNPQGQPELLLRIQLFNSVRRFLYQTPFLVRNCRILV